MLSKNERNVCTAPSDMDITLESKNKKRKKRGLGGWEGRSRTGEESTWQELIS